MEKKGGKVSIKNPSSFLEDFNDKIKNLYEVDIGDFKRKALLYLSRLQEQIQEQNDSNSLTPSFYKIKEEVICNNTTDIEALKFQIIEHTEKLLYKVK